MARILAVGCVARLCACLLATAWANAAPPWQGQLQLMRRDSMLDHKVRPRHYRSTAAPWSPLDLVHYEGCIRQSLDNHSGMGWQPTSEELFGNAAAGAQVFPVGPNGSHFKSVAMEAWESGKRYFAVARHDENDFEGGRVVLFDQTPLVDSLERLAEGCFSACTDIQSYYCGCADEVSAKRVNSVCREAGYVALENAPGCTAGGMDNVHDRTACETGARSLGYNGNARVVVSEKMAGGCVVDITRSSVNILFNYGGQKLRRSKSRYKSICAMNLDTTWWAVYSMTTTTTTADMS